MGEQIFSAYAGLCGLGMAGVILCLAIMGCTKIIEAIMAARPPISDHTDCSMPDADDDFLAWVTEECADLKPLIKQLGKKPLMREEP